MKHLRELVLGAALFVLGTSALAQGGGFGGGGFGGQQGGRQMESTVSYLDSLIERVLGPDQTKSVLTPGEAVEWDLKLKAGQVVYADASSEAFDPALEITDGTQTVAKNDDRYPGDQRPLLLWRCEKDGDYKLQVRCFQNKSGGQSFSRYKVLDSYDAGENGFDKDVPGDKPFLIRMSLNQGAIQRFWWDTNNAYGCADGPILFPNGLPEPGDGLSSRIAPSVGALVAPIKGDYYLHSFLPVNPGSLGKIKFRTKAITPVEVSGALGSKGQAPGNEPAIFAFPAKKGQVIRVEAKGLLPQCSLQAAEAPNYKEFDLEKPDANPLLPHPGVVRSLPYTQLSGRTRDNRTMVLRVERDATLWLCTNGVKSGGGGFEMQVLDALTSLPESSSTGKLRIGDTDYWAFDASAGDVLSLKSESQAFAQEVHVYDPNLGQRYAASVGPDQETLEWRMTVQLPGRYMVAVSSVGGGGGGAYSLTRKLFRAKGISVGTPVDYAVLPGEVVVYRLSVKKGEPLMMRRTGPAWNFGFQFLNEAGAGVGIGEQGIDDHTRYAIIAAPEAQTYLVVIEGSPGEAKGTLIFEPLQGYKKG